MRLRFQSSQLKMSRQMANVRARMNVIHEAGLFQGRLGFAQDDEFMVGGDFRSGLWLFGFGAGLVSSMPLRAG